MTSSESDRQSHQNSKQQSDSTANAPYAQVQRIPNIVLGPVGSLAHSVRSDEAHFEKPSWIKLMTLPLYLVVLVAVGCGSFLLEQPVVGCILIALGILPTIAMAVLAHKQFPVYVQRPDAQQGYQELHHFQDEELGMWLGGTREDIQAWAPTLVDEEVSSLNENRLSEVHATRDWLAEVGPFTRVETTSDDGTKLVAHKLVCNPDSEYWVVLAHGYHGTWRDCLIHARQYSEHGFNPLIVDMRAHGESGGAWIGLGWLDRRDLVAWCAWLAQDADARIVVHGEGMGAAAALLASAEHDLPNEVRAIIADASYSDVWNVAVPLLSQDAKTSPHPLIDLMRLNFLSMSAGYDVALANPAQAVSSSQVPILLFQSDQDVVVPTFMAYRLADACGGAAAGKNHACVLTEGAGHGQAALADPVGYYWRLFLFVERYL